MKKLIFVLALFLFSLVSFTQERELSDYEKYRLEQEAKEDPPQEEVFYIVEDMPKFKGEDADTFRKYIAENVKYPAEAAKKGIEGKVFVEFVVNSNGDVVNVKIKKSVNSYLDAEAIRVVMSSPKWEPGLQRGIPVSVSFTFPINFVLDEQVSEPVVINNYINYDRDIRHSLYFGYSWNFSHFYWDPYYYGYYDYYWGYPYYGYDYYYRPYYRYYRPYYSYNYYYRPHYGHNYYRNYYSNGRYAKSSVLGNSTYRRYNNTTSVSRNISNAPITNKGAALKNTKPINTRISKSTPVYSRPATRSTYNRSTQSRSTINRSHRTTTVTSPRTTNSQRSYSAPSRSSSSYNRPSVTPQRSSSPSRSYSTPSRSSSSYSAPSRSSAPASRSYSTPSRSSSSYSSPSRSSSSGASRSSSSSSSSRSSSGRR